MTVVIPCRRVRIKEYNGTTDYNVGTPSMTDTQCYKGEGEETIFEADPGQLFQTGDIVGYTETVSGTITMSKVCE